MFIGFPQQTISTASTLLLLIELVVLMPLLPLVTRSASATHCIWQTAIVPHLMLLERGSMFFGGFEPLPLTIPTHPALFLWEYCSFSGYNFIYLPLWCAHHQYPFQLTGICIIFCCACIIISHSDLTKPCPETPCPIVNISGGRIHAFRRSLSRLCLD